MMDININEQTNKKKNKQLLRIIGIVVVCLEVFLFTFEEALDLAFSEKRTANLYKSKCIYAGFRVSLIIINSIDIRKLFSWDCSFTVHLLTVNNDYAIWSYYISNIRPSIPFIYFN